MLIDIECGELTSSMFSLPWKIAVPDTLFVEELKNRHSHLPELGLMIKTMSGDLVAESYKLREKYAKPSVNDFLALMLAKHEGCQLLTNDKALRNAAYELNVEVHGTIWLVEQMLQNKKITAQSASVSFQKMQNAGSRLPLDEINKLLEKL